MSTSSTPMKRWSPPEDRALIDAMSELVKIPGWKTDNGQLKNGAYAKLEALIKQNMPECDKKAKPHIESRVKTLRRHYDAVTEMMSPSTSGFGWNDEGKFVTCSQSVWDEWVKSHKNAAGLRNKPLPYYDELGKNFGKDRAVGNKAENIKDVLEELEDEQLSEREEVPVNEAEETSPTLQSTPTQPTTSTIPSVRRTKRARNETIEALQDFSSKLAKMSDVMEAANNHIGRLADCFQHESNSAERRLQVTTEVQNIGGLTPTQVLFMSKKIAMQPLEVDFFFSLPEDFKFPYVQGLLLPEQ